MFRRLLVPVDFRACGVQATRHVCQLIRTIGGTLILLHVLDGRLDSGQSREQLQLLGTEVRHRPVIRVVPIHDADVAATILEVAQAERADLLILGTHGRDDLRSGVLGQVAQRLVLTADLPIQLVPERLRSHPQSVSVGDVPDAAESQCDTDRSALETAVWINQKVRGIRVFCAGGRRTALGSGQDVPKYLAAHSAIVRDGAAISLLRSSASPLDVSTRQMRPT